MIAYIFGHILVKPTIFQVSTILMYSTSCHCKFVLPMIFSFSTYVNNSMEWLGMAFQVIVKFRGSPAAKPHNLGGHHFEVYRMFFLHYLFFKTLYLQNLPGDIMSLLRILIFIPVISSSSLGLKVTLLLLLFF